MKYIVIGNGSAGMAAAEAIRGLDAAGEIRMFTKEDMYHYSRPRLIEYLAGAVPAEKLVIRGPEFLSKLNISLERSTTVEAIDVSGRAIILAGGRTERFDRLVLASGASSFLPPVEGSGLDCVFTLRTLADADRIIARCAEGRRAVVIGGGLLGIETAVSLTKRGVKTTVVEVFDRLLPRQLDSDGAALLQSLLEAKGISFLLRKKTVAVREREAASAPSATPAAASPACAEVLFEDGASAPADFVVFSAGVRSEVGLARGAGIACDRGILVDAHMETSAKGIYAAGDAAQFGNVVYGLWPPAREQGSFAGRNAAGDPAVYAGSQLSARLKVSGIELVSLGSIESCEGVEVRTSRGDGVFERLFLRDGRLAGAILIGDVSAAPRLEKLLKSGGSIA